MNEKLKDLVHTWLTGWNTRRKISAARLKEFGYDIGDKFLEINTSREGVSSVYRIYRATCEHGGREAKFCFLQKDDDSENGEILDIKFKDFEKLT